MDDLTKNNPEVACLFHAVVLILIIIIIAKLLHLWTMTSTEGQEDRQSVAFSSGATQRHYQELTAANQDPYSTLTVVEMKARGTNQAFSGSGIAGLDSSDSSAPAATAPVASADVTRPVPASNVTPVVPTPAVSPQSAPSSGPSGPITAATVAVSGPATTTKEHLTSGPEAPFFWGVLGDIGAQTPPGGDREAPITWGVGDNLSDYKKRISGQPKLPTGRQGIKRENLAESKNVYGGVNWNRGEDILQGKLLQ